MRKPIGGGRFSGADCLGIALHTSPVTQLHRLTRQSYHGNDEVGTFFNIGPAVDGSCGGEELYWQSVAGCAGRGQREGEV
jgi:hypothetical protein